MENETKNEAKIKVFNRDCTIITNPDSETVLSLYDDTIKVDLVNIGEGVCGDYDKEDPDDVNLLRFNVYVNNPDADEEFADPWLEVEDASFCTSVPADTDEEILDKIVKRIFTEYRNTIPSYDAYLNGPSVKSLGERLSWINPEWVA